jgi:hypothetical protein
MTLKRDARGTLRDYKREYSRFQSSKKAKRDRAARNTARRRAEREGRVHKGDEKEIDHKNSTPTDNRPANLIVVSRRTNRAKKENSRRRGSRRNRSSWGL